MGAPGGAAQDPGRDSAAALLVEVLAATQVHDHSSWVALHTISAHATATSGSWQQAVADALRIEQRDVVTVTAPLRAAGLVTVIGSLTALGAAQLAAARSAVSAATGLLVDGITEQDRATVRNVLDLIRHRADGLLSS